MEALDASGIQWPGAPAALYSADHNGHLGIGTCCQRGGSWDLLQDFLVADDNEFPGLGILAVGAPCGLKKQFDRRIRHRLVGVFADTPPCEMRSRIHVRRGRIRPHLRRLWENRGIGGIRRREGTEAPSSTKAITNPLPLPASFACYLLIHSRSSFGFCRRIGNAPAYVNLFEGAGPSTFFFTHGLQALPTGNLPPG
jgi:hypothetical protein